uniref:Uncharacterized protein n=1 Tax=Romanomermis culicivorax TaxID=13658 RepID=A0A915JWD0_ROMCU
HHAVFICKRFVYTKAVKPSPFYCLQAKPEHALSLYLLSTTEAAIHCPFISLLLLYPALLPTITTVRFRIK